jgi:hypothetical protein
VRGVGCGEQAHGFCLCVQAHCWIRDCSSWPSTSYQQLAISNHNQPTCYDFVAVHAMASLPCNCCAAVVLQEFEISFFKGVSRTSTLFSVGMDAGRLAGWQGRVSPGSFCRPQAITVITSKTVANRVWHCVRLRKTAYHPVRCDVLMLNTRLACAPICSCYICSCAPAGSHAMDKPQCWRRKHNHQALPLPSSLLLPWAAMSNSICCLPTPIQAGGPLYF